MLAIPTQSAQSRVNSRNAKCCSVLAIRTEHAQSGRKALCRVYLFEG